MDVAEFFGQMESEFRSATPWPWPRTMTEDQLDWFRCWGGFWPMHGVYLSDGVRVTGTGIDVDVKVYFAGWDTGVAESISHKMRPCRLRHLLSAYRTGG